MNKVIQNETKQCIGTLNNVMEFLNRNTTSVELVSITHIGKKYAAINGYDKKEIYVTRCDATISSFHKGKYVDFEVVFYEGLDIQSKVNMVTAKLEKLASNKNLKTKFQYYWKRFKELQHE